MEKNLLWYAVNKVIISIIHCRCRCEQGRHIPVLYIIPHHNPWNENENLLVWIKFLNLFLYTIVLNKIWKIYWSKQIVTGLGSEGRCLSWGLPHRVTNTKCSQVKLLYNLLMTVFIRFTTSSTRNTLLWLLILTSTLKTLLCSITHLSVSGR